MLGVYMSRKSTKTIHEVGEIYMSGMSEQMARHFENLIELRFEQVEGSVSPSDFVLATVGVDNVCERAALADGGKLIFPKLAHGGVTVAFSKVTIELSFKER